MFASHSCYYLCNFSNSFFYCLLFVLISGEIQALDRVIVEAQKHGIRLLLSLANNLDAYGGKTQYVKWAWEEGIGTSASNDSFFFDPSIRGYFKTYLRVNTLFLKISF